jgi:hypothetical protein
MKMSVKNNTDLAGNPLFPGVIINTPDTGGTGVSPDAVGGNKRYPLPYPFAHVGPVAAGATVVQVIHVEDMRRMSVPWLPLEPSREWQMLVQQGIVTVTFSELSTGKNVEDAIIPA